MSADTASPKSSKPKSDKKHKSKHKDKSEEKRSKEHHREEVDITGDPHTSPRKEKRGKHGHEARAAKDAERKHTTAKSNNTTAQSASSTFTIQRTSLYLPVAPITLGSPIPGICAEHLSPLLLTYFPPLSGVVLSYTDVTLSESPMLSISSGEPVLATASDEYAAPFVWVTASFLVFCPRKGVKLTGFVNLQTESHLGLICYNLFGVSIPRDRLPSTWSWVWESDHATTEDDRTAGHNATYEDGQGYWADEEGVRVPDELTFRILSCDSSPWSESDKTVVNIRGSLLDDAGDEAVDEDRRQQREKRKARAKEREAKEGISLKG